jgi:polysaccharide chain length determinant protein (PEP-CTERM system associated)
MQQSLEKVMSELRGAWRFRRYALVAAWGVCLVGWAVVLAIPDTYEAQARVNVDTRTALSDVLAGQVIRQDFESQLNLIRQSLLGRSNLELVAEQVGIDLASATPAQRDLAITSLVERIEIALEPATNRDPRIPNTLYRITFQDGDRATALKVVDILLNSFVEGSMRSDRTGTATAQKFLREQIADYGARLAEAESQLAAFKKNNVGLVPGDQGDYFQRLTGQIQAAQDLQAQLIVATSRRNELQRQLRGETPFVPQGDGRGSPSGGGAGQQDTASRIQETQARLDDMLLRFTDKHPDVLAARETLEQLRLRQKEELAALKRGDAGVAATSRAQSNPVYQNIQSQLNQIDVEIAAMRAQLAERRRNEADLRRVVDTVPEIEAEYARLTRDYEVTRTQYNDLLSRLERARLSGDAEQTGTVKFNIVDPPAASFQPIFPNRPVLLAVVLIAGLGIGAGVAYLAHLLKPVFSDARSLGEATGLPVLGTVMRSWLDRQRAELRGSFMRYVGASAALVVLFIATLLLQQPVSRMLRQVLS